MKKEFFLNLTRIIEANPKNLSQYYCGDCRMFGAICS